MAKQVIRITENDIKRIVTESVNRILNESYFDDESNYEEVRGWIEMMMRCFGATKGSALDVLRSSNDEIMQNQFRTIHGVNIEYNVMGYGEPEMGIECDATCDGKFSVADDIVGFIQTSVKKSDGFFTLDMDYEPNANFVRFKLIPFNALYM